MSKFKKGQKVVPVSKTVSGYGDLSSSGVWNDSKARGFVYVTEVNEDKEQYTCSREAGHYAGDFFKESDLIPYIEEYKGMNVGDTVSLFGSPRVITEKNGEYFFSTPDGRRTSSGYKSLVQLLDYFWGAKPLIEEYKGFKVGDKITIHGGNHRVIVKENGKYFFRNFNGSQTCRKEDSLKELVDFFSSTLKHYEEPEKPSIEKLQKEVEELKEQVARLNRERKDALKVINQIQELTEEVL